MPLQEFFTVALGLVIVGFLGRRVYLTLTIPALGPAQLEGLLHAREPLLLLDVRTAAERRVSKIDGSLHIPVGELGKRLGELAKHREKQIVCYCASGNRSLSAAGSLKRKGFNVANLKGGIGEWNFHQKTR